MTVSEGAVQPAVRPAARGAVCLIYKPIPFRQARPPIKNRGRGLVSSINWRGA